MLILFSLCNPITFVFLASIRDLLVSRILPAHPLWRGTIQFIIIKRRLLIPLLGKISERGAALPSPHAAQGDDPFRAPAPPWAAVLGAHNDIPSCQLINNPSVWQPRLAGKKLKVKLEGCESVQCCREFRWSVTQATKLGQRAWWGGMVRVHLCTCVCMWVWAHVYRHMCVCTCLITGSHVVLMSPSCSVTHTGWTVVTGRDARRTDEGNHCKPVSSFSRQQVLRAGLGAMLGTPYSVILHPVSVPLHRAGNEVPSRGSHGDMISFPQEGWSQVCRMGQIQWASVSTAWRPSCWIGVLRTLREHDQEWPEVWMEGCRIEEKITSKCQVTWSKQQK